MAYENLKAAIKQAIKQNGNQEITGNLLQSTLLNIVNTIGAEYKFLGFANSSTVPPTSEEGRLLYFTTGHGDRYINFPTSASGTYITLEYGVYALTREANSKYWRSDVVVPITQELGTALDKIMSQKAIKSELDKKIDKTSIAQTSGTSEDKVMSQKATTVELNKKANTADVDTKFTEEKNRVDGELNKKFDKASIVQESGEDEDKVMSQKAITDKLTELEKKQVIYNLDANVPLSSGQFYTSTTARAAVPTSIRKIGLIITYKTDATTSVTEQFIGNSISNWWTDSNWKNVGSDGGNKILEWNTDVATTRKQVPLKERKAGMQISYLHPDFGWVNEQYVGEVTSDIEWVKDANWEASVKQEQIEALSNQLLDEVDKIQNGYTQEFEEINIGNVTDGQALIHGTIKPINGIAVSDMFNVEKYRGLTLTCIYIGTFVSSNSYAFYDALGNVQSYGMGTSPYQNISIPGNASQMRLSCTSANISKLKIFLNSEKSLGISSLEGINLALNLISVNKKYVVGSTLETFVAISSTYGIEIPSARFTKAKIYAPEDMEVKLGVITYNKDIDKYVPYKMFTFEAKTGTALYDIDLNLIGKSKSYLSFIKGVGYAVGTPQYPGVYMYNIGSYTALRNDSEIENTQHKCRFTVDLLYDEAIGVSEEPVETMVLSDTFKGKDYVSYGDSITAGAKKDETGAETYGLCIANYFGFNHINKAQYGTIPYGQGKSANLTDANLEAVTENTRLVTISGGQNSWVTDEDINSQDRTTSIGSINYYIDQIRLRSPKCVIILCPTYIGNGDNQCAKDYQRIADNKHVGLAPTLDLHLIDWEGDKSVNLLRYDNIHFNAFGAKKFAAVVREYARQFFF